MKKVFLAAAVLLLPTVSNAADLPVKAAPIATPAYNWTGFYAGIVGGYGWSDPSYSLTGDNAAGADWIKTVISDNPGITPTFGRSYKAQGGTVGGLAGYDYQFRPTLVAGVVADLNYSDIRGSLASPTVGFNQGGPFSVLADSHLNWFGTVRGRLGWLPTSGLLLYGTGGLAFGEIKASSAFFLPLSGFGRGIFPDGTFIQCAFANNVTCLAGSGSRTSVGWTAGLGGEARLTQNVSFTVEYLHINLDGAIAHMTVVPPSLGNGSIAANYAQANYDIVRGAIVYRFH
jgi:outer membrane immunogenic protein